MSDERPELEDVALRNTAARVHVLSRTSASQRATRSSSSVNMPTSFARIYARLMRSPCTANMRPTSSTSCPVRVGGEPERAFELHDSWVYRGLLEVGSFAKEFPGDPSVQRRDYIFARSAGGALWRIWLASFRIPDHLRRGDPATPVASVRIALGTTSAEAAIAPRWAQSPSRGGPATRPRPRLSLRFHKGC